MREQEENIEGLDDGLAEELAEMQTEPEADQDGYWLALARDAYEISTDYLDSGIRKQWQAATAHQNNEHAPGSKYHSEAYRSRSKTFRPKTRSNNVTAEATFAKAIFSTSELVSITPMNDNDEKQEASAEINQQLLQYRLTNSIPWFLTANGAYQDARVYGVAASYQTWEFEEDEDGQIIRDEPVVELLPPENIRFEPNADWRNPIGTSPYVVRLVPMYASDAINYFKKKGWRSDFTPSQLVAAGESSEDDQTRLGREGKDRTDPADQSGERNEFSLVWCHENFVRVNGDDYVYWTVGTQILVNDPMPVTEAYPHLKRGERPIVLGYCSLEAHKNYPKSPTALIEDLQKDANDIANQRFDNIRLIMNKRYLIRRGSTGIDLAALSRSVPGSSIMTGDPDKDVRILETPDVTASSYNEQDRIDLQIDELTGAFSQQTVSNNRNLNETVGGMNMMNAGADNVSEYAIRIFIETWVEPVMRQLVRMEQFYETDQTILAIAADKAEVYQKFGIDQVTDDLLKAELTVNVNIGFGNTDPQKKLDRLNQAVQLVAQLPGMVERIDSDEIAKEIFGKSGYRDGQRFFKPVDEAKQQQGQPPPADQLQMAKLQLEKQRLQWEMEQQFPAEMKLKRDIEMMRLANQENIKLTELKAKLGLEYDKLDTTRKVAAGDQNLRLAQQQLQATNLKEGYDTF